MSRPPWGNDLAGLFRGLSRIGSAAAEIRSQEVTKAWATSSLRPLVNKGAASLQETVTNAMQNPQMVQANVSERASEAVSRISLVAEGIKAYRTQAAPVQTAEMSESIQEVYDPVYDPNIEELSIEDIMMHEAMSGHQSDIVQEGDKKGAEILVGIGEITDAAVANIGEVQGEVSRRLEGLEPTIEGLQLKESDITEEHVQAIKDKLQELEGVAYGYDVGSVNDKDSTEAANEIIENSVQADLLESSSAKVVSKEAQKEAVQDDVQELSTPELSFEDVMMQEALSSHDDLVVEAVGKMADVNSQRSEGGTSVTDVKSEAVQKAEEFDQLIESIQFEEREITQEHLEAVGEKLSEIQNLAFGHDLRIFKEMEQPEKKESGSKDEQVSLSQATAEASVTISELENSSSVTQKDQSGDVEKNGGAIIGSEEKVLVTSGEKSTPTLSEKENAVLELDNTIAQVAKSIDLGASEKAVRDFDVEVQIEQIETKSVNMDAKPPKPYSGFSGSDSPMGISNSTAALSGAGLAVAATAAAAAVAPGASAASVAGGTLAAARYQEEEKTCDAQEEKSQDEIQPKKLDDSEMKESPKVTEQDISQTESSEAALSKTEDTLPEQVESNPEGALPTAKESESVVSAVASEQVLKIKETESSSQAQSVATEIPESIPQVIETDSTKTYEALHSSNLSESVSLESPEMVVSSTSEPVPEEISKSSATTVASDISSEMPKPSFPVSSDSETLFETKVAEPALKENSESLIPGAGSEEICSYNIDKSFSEKSPESTLSVVAADAVPESLDTVSAASVESTTIPSVSAASPVSLESEVPPLSVSETEITPQASVETPTKVKVSVEASEAHHSPKEVPKEPEVQSEFPEVPETSTESPKVAYASLEMSSVADTLIERSVVRDTASGTSEIADTTTETAKVLDASVEEGKDLEYSPEIVKVHDGSTDTVKVEAATAKTVQESHTPTETAEVLSASPGTAKVLSGDHTNADSATPAVPVSASMVMECTESSVTENGAATVSPSVKDVGISSVDAAAVTGASIAAAAAVNATAAAAVNATAAAAVNATTAAAVKATAAAASVASEIIPKPSVVEQEKKAAPISKPKPKLLGRKPLAKDKPKSTLADNAQARKVPHSRLGRMLTFGSLAAGLGAGTIAEMTRRTLGVNQGKGSGSLLDASPFLTEANAKRIVDTLCKVRGAALKLGQMLSIQDSALINPQVQKIFERVRQSADFMPMWQLERAIKEQLGDDWKSKVSGFDEKPFAAASIGQVHLVTLLDGRSAAMKIQYPGVAEGIESDINNLMSTLRVANILPEGLYVDSVIDVAKRELGWECDYVREAACTEQYRELVKPYSEFYVPEVISELCTQQIFTSELIAGVPVDKCVDMDQDTKNYICEKILRLCLLELFRFGFMQTDPNWANFFYNADTEQLALLDFGACRAYDKSFVDKYIHIIHGAATKDRGKVLQYSQELGFLTGYEAKVMVDAHIDAIMILGEAFQNDKPFQFGSQDTTHRIQHLVPVMLSHRMCAPPEESYSLHRKMSGVFLLCAKLDGQVNCKPLFEEVFNTYKFGGTWKEFHASLNV